MATPVAGFPTTLYAGGTPTTMTNEACTKLTANTRYQITDATKRIIDPATTGVFEKDVVPNGVWASATADIVSTDFLFGIITTVDLGAATLVRLSGKYIPRLALVEARTVEITESRELLDDTAFGDLARTKMAGHRTCEGSVEQLDDGNEDLDTGAGTTKLKTLLDAGTPLLLEVRPGGAGSYFRAWIRLKGRKASTSPSDLVKFGFPWESAPQDYGALGASGLGYANFGWGE